MSAAINLIQTTPSLRPLGAAFGGVAIASVLLGLLAFGQIASAPAEAAGGSVPVAHDRGWSMAASGGASEAALFDRGWATAPSTTTSTPAATSSRAGVSSGTRGANGTGGSNGTRLAR